MASPESLNHQFYERDLPRDIEQHLESLYQSPFCTIRYFEIFRGGAGLNLLVLSKEGAPRHLLVYTISGRELTVLNELVKIEQEYLLSGADAFFDRYPAVTTVNFNCQQEMIAASRYPWRLWKSTGDIAIALPSRFDAYQKRLGGQTQKHLRYYLNRLQREFADFAFQVAATDEINPATFGRIIDMNRLRMRDKGLRSGFDAVFEERIKEFCRHYGLITTVSVGGRIVAGAICYEVGNQVYLEAISHDPEFNRYNPGQVCLYLTVQHLIDRGRDSFHLLWGENEYKFRFLGVRQKLYFFTLYRSDWHKVTDIRRQARHSFTWLNNQVEYLMVKYVIGRLRERR